MKWREEFDKIAKRDGTLRPPVIVEEARPKRSPLHKYFEWEDGRAAELYRLDQARRMIQRYEIVLVESCPNPVRAFVSFAEDRKTGGAGYRQMARVMRDPEQRAGLLEQALAELRRLRARYGHLQELAQVFAAMDAVKPRAKKKRVAR